MQMHVQEWIWMLLHLLMKIAMKTMTYGVEKILKWRENITVNPEKLKNLTTKKI